MGQGKIVTQSSSPVGWEYGDKSEEEKKQEKKLELHLRDSQPEKKKKKKCALNWNEEGKNCNGVN